MSLFISLICAIDSLFISLILLFYFALKLVRRDSSCRIVFMLYRNYVIYLFERISRDAHSFLHYTFERKNMMFQLYLK